LEKDIVEDTSGHYKKALVALLTAARPTGNMVDRTQATKDVQDLVKAGTKSWGTDESKFITIFCMRSFSQLRAMFEEYEKQTGKKIEQEIELEFSSNVKKTFLAIIAAVRDRQQYFADNLNKTMKGLGTKDQTLLRIIVSRAEIDMVQIKLKFQQAYNKSLGEFIKVCFF
jgi:hypothetical protein